MENNLSPGYEREERAIKSSLKGWTGPNITKASSHSLKWGLAHRQRTVQSSIATIKISPSARSARGQRLNGGGRGKWGQIWNTKGRLKCVASNEHYQCTAFAAVAWSLNITSHWTESVLLFSMYHWRGCSPKNLHPFIIFSPSCCPKPIWLCFLDLKDKLQIGTHSRSNTFIIY